MTSAVFPLILYSKDIAHPIHMFQFIGNIFPVAYKHTLWIRLNISYIMLAIATHTMKHANESRQQSAVAAIKWQNRPSHLLIWFVVGAVNSLMWFVSFNLVVSFLGKYWREFILWFDWPVLRLHLLQKSCNAMIIHTICICFVKSFFIYVFTHLFILFFRIDWRSLLTNHLKESFCWRSDNGCISFFLSRFQFSYSIATEENIHIHGIVYISIGVWSRHIMTLFYWIVRVCIV